jgi:hypothetical protein
MGGLMKPLPYWQMGHDMGPMDVWHAEDPKVCNKTITYLLTGYSGLFADLALLAQTAAIAREVCSCLYLVNCMYKYRSSAIGPFSLMTHCGIVASAYMRRTIV